MISYLKGKIIYKSAKFVILENNKIGYKIFISPTILEKIKLDFEKEFFTYLRVREDDLSLYGFEKMEDLEFFELLITVSGVGPKFAQNALASFSVNDLKESISCEDSSLLKKVSGIGTKTAERIIIELKGKLSKFASSGKNRASSMSEEIDALQGLGYSSKEAIDALKSIDKKIKDSSDRIKMALKVLGKK